MKTIKYFEGKLERAARRRMRGGDFTVAQLKQAIARAPSNNINATFGKMGGKKVLMVTGGGAGGGKSEAMRIMLEGRGVMFRENLGGLRSNTPARVRRMSKRRQKRAAP